MITQILKKNAPALLLLAGVVGFVCTNVLTAKATIKAQEKLEELEKSEEPVETKDKVLTVIPCYVPAVVAGVASAGMIFAGNRKYANIQAGLMSAYTVLQHKFNHYRQKVIEEIGRQREEELLEEIKKERYTEGAFDSSSGNVLVYDDMEDRYLEITMLDLVDAEYQLNKAFTANGKVSLNDFYELIGLEPTANGEEFGWDIETVYDDIGYCWIEIEHELVLQGSEPPYYILRYEAPPVRGYKNI